jgi:hypothetical protein
VSTLVSELSPVSVEPVSVEPDSVGADAVSVSWGVVLSGEVRSLSVTVAVESPGFVPTRLFEHPFSQDS